MLAAVLLTECSNDNPQTPTVSTEDATISVSADVWRVMDGTRATTFDDQTALQTAGSFTCTVYNAGTTMPYVATTTVNWDGTNSIWTFSDGKHYWPASGNLDFFAYLPSEIPSYISAITYSIKDEDEPTPDSPNPTFTCTAIDENTSKEFIYAVAANQSRGVTGEVTLTFIHPFARIQLAEGTISSNVTINAIRLTGIKNSGTYTHSTGWTGQSGNETYTASTLESIPRLVVPQDWPGTIEVDAEWTEWGEEYSQTFSTTVPTAWNPGYSYTYTLSLSKYALTVDIENFTEQW